MVENVIKALHLLEEEPSSNAKKEILKDYDDEGLRSILKYTYDPFIQFYLRGDNALLVQKINSRRNKNEEINLKSLFTALNKLNKREVTGHEAINTIFSVIENVSDEECLLVQRILNKDLRVGISAKTINKIYPKLCREYGVMLCDSIEVPPIPEEELVKENFENLVKIITQVKKISSLQYPVWADMKQDGIRGTYNFNATQTLTTRNGNEIEGYDHIINLLKDMNKDNPNRMLEGELKGGTLNETMTQLNRIKGKDTSNFVYVLFDKLEYMGDKNNFSQRYNELKALVETFNHPNIQLNTSKMCNTPEELARYLLNLHFSGEEGIVVKLDKPYEFKRSKHWIKLKLFYSVDVKVLDLEEGEGRNAGRLGAFVIDYNGVRVNVGTGYTDEMRDEYWDHKEELIGSVIEIAYKQLTPDKSLQFPSFVKLRPDLSIK